MIDTTQQSKASIFPCDCGTEGIVVVKEAQDEREFDGSPFINLMFFGVGSYSDGRLSWWNRLRWVWKIFRTGNPFEDMVILRSNVAKNMAYHILYLLERSKPKKVDVVKYLVDLPVIVDSLPPSFGKIQ